MVLVLALIILAEVIAYCYKYRLQIWLWMNRKPEYGKADRIKFLNRRIEDDSTEIERINKSKKEETK